MSEVRAASQGVLEWLMAGDPAIRWQALRDLHGASRADWEAERARVGVEGWGRELLDSRDEAGTWGGGLYSPKWISTTYSLVLLRRLGLAPEHPTAVEGCALLMEEGLAPDGGIDLSVTLGRSETCLTGFVLALVTELGFESSGTERMVDYLLREQMPDGGWNCQRYQGATHSSFHTTINVLEGLRGYANGGGPRRSEVECAETRGREFFSEHHLYRSHRTGDVVDPRMTRFSFPPRWYHDVLRTLDYFQASGAPRDSRLEDPIELVRRKCGKDGRWPLQNRHPGKAFFEMEAVREPSRWNTLRALRVLKWWDSAAP